ncbi:MAG: DNA polymerase I [Clostridium sp.]|nr:DNA polymerase I [Prevotella sp.]MCM1429678.1 DNA polymerase I [Clostridium sp.]MCM1476167.1 DNA polymerase I [Muribaculaceae bacterium]
MEEKKLFLLDAYALIFRAYYALIKMPRITREGFNTSAIFGFVNTLEELLKKERPSHLAVCFDPAGPTFRSEAFADYKGERPSTPEDIKLSIPIIKEIIRAYNIPILEKEGFEADDVIGTMAKRASAEGFTVYMMTPDKDFGQLVGSNVIQYKPAYRGGEFELRGEQQILERYSLKSTSQVIDLLALMGDKVDNIPGCPGVGEKTAIKLIADFGSVENLIASTDKLKGALKKKVEENAEQIVFSKYLATIRTDVPLEVKTTDLVCKQPDTSKLFAIFSELEFKSLTERVRKRLSQQVQLPSSGLMRSLFDFEESEDTATKSNVESGVLSSLATTPHEFILVDSAEALMQMSETLMQADSCGVALLTRGDNDMALTWEATAVALSEGHGWFVPASFAEGQAALLDLFARKDIEKVTVSAKTDIICSWKERNPKATIYAPGVENSPVRVFEPFFDISLAHYLLQPDARFDMLALAHSLLNYEMLPAIKEDKKNPVSLTSSESINSLCERALITLRLRPVLEKSLRDVGEWELLKELEFPLVGVLTKMEIAGVRIAPEALKLAADDMQQRLVEVEKEIFEIAGIEFNVGSPSQVGEVLFDRMQLDAKAKRTKSGQYSTSEAVLEKVAHKSPIVGKILDYRRLRKLLNTYLTALPECINPATGRIHTNYNQTVTATGRLSSSNPNLQNIPVREEMGREIRRAFIPSEGNLFLSADYSQIELRLVADFAGDETLIDAFRQGDDVHAITAAKIYHKNPEEVTADERRHAKTANFGILYGITAFGLASRLGIPRSEAKMLIDNYFATFPSIRQYMTDSIERARETGYAITRSGRRRYLPDIRSANPTVRGFAERNAVNAPVQGSAADIIKRAMIDIDAQLERRAMKSMLIMQVHDELNFDVVPEESAELQEIVETLMQKAYTGRVTLTASAGIAANWLDAH